jgi:hypothetical protein
MIWGAFFKLGCEDDFDILQLGSSFLIARLVANSDPYGLCVARPEGCLWPAQSS